MEKKSNETSFTPKWSDKAPLEGSYRSIFKWADPKGFKHPNKRLYAMLRDELGMSDDDFKFPKNYGDEMVVCDHPILLSEKQIQRFVEIVGKENIAKDDYSRVKYTHGQAVEEVLKLRSGQVDAVSDLIIHPRDKEDVRQIVLYCDQEKIPIYIYGGGSSACLGLKPVKGGITMAMNTHMNKILALNESNHTVRVQPGMMGPAYEKMLNDAPETLNAKRRYTGGHFPQSFEGSSVGGWVVTLGAGQQSTYYGDAYDLVISQEYITPAGKFTTLDYPSTATGPKLNDIMKGSEGCFGVLVEITMTIFHYQPENQKNFAYIFPSWEEAVAASREISQGEFGLPSVLRISDAEETQMALKLYGVEGTIFDKFMKFRGLQEKKRSLMIGHTEGELGFSKHVKKMVHKVCKAHKGMYLTGYPVSKWKSGRYSDPYMREDMNDYGIAIDTLECSVTWSNLHEIHEKVRAHIKSSKQTLCMTHASHFYPQGTNLYFIFIRKLKNPDEHRSFQRSIIAKINEVGGSLSHHHGVGKMMGPLMEEHIGTEQMKALRALKTHFDPNNIMNPGGSLGLDSIEGSTTFESCDHETK